MFNLYGIIIGLSALLIIGIYHPIIIKGEYYFGKKIWWIFLILGLVALTASLFVNNQLFSSILGVFGFSSLWGIHEIIEQEERVKRGWFPKNPKKKK